jgi:N-acetylmuramoyl-L-alanine amidase CwlA
MPWKGIVNLPFDQMGFDSYCHSLRWNAWRPSFITIHNTAKPSLSQRPQGFTQVHINNLVNYYKNDLGWNACPHLFVDDRQIWVFTPLTMSGVHSPSWNKIAIGIEMLGDYDREAFDTGRGAKVKANALAASATLCAVLGLNPDTIKLHYEDPNTTHKCPGKNVVKAPFIEGVKRLILSRHSGEHVIS